MENPCKNCGLLPTEEQKVVELNHYRYLSFWIECPVCHQKTNEHLKATDALEEWNKNN